MSSDSFTLPTHISASLSKGPGKKMMMRISSMPNIGTSPRRIREKQPEQSIINYQTPSPSPGPLEVGSLVEVVNNQGITVYGVIRWMGIPEGKTDTWAGIELVRRVSNLNKRAALFFDKTDDYVYFTILRFQDIEVKGFSDGVYKERRYFTCKGNSALFVPIKKCSPDSRFVSSSPVTETFKTTEVPSGLLLFLKLCKYD